MTLDLTAATARLDRLPDLYPGPGGVAGIVHEGRVIAMRAWGHKAVAQAAPMEVTTRLPICSISKQFTCAAFLAALEPEAMDAKVADHLPALKAQMPTIRQLMANQSGLRDYWALTVLLGAQPDGEFRRSDAATLLSQMQTGHFEPGTSYSYCNHNFRILAEILVAETGRSLDDHYAALFDAAGMKTAFQCSDTSAPADGVVGYEGNPATGYFPAMNRLYWWGDAGIAASIGDMLAWEAHIDASGPDGFYARMSAAPAFTNGAASAYGYGLAHAVIGGGAVTGHGGALRGFRAHRWHLAAERLSVVVMFNHEASAAAAAGSVIEAALGAPAKAAPKPGGWRGQWLDADSGLSIRVDPALDGVFLGFATGPEALAETAEGAAGAGVELTREGADLRFRRPGENLDLRAAAVPFGAASGAEIAGRYHWAEMGADLTITHRDGATHAVASGHFGTGPAERLHGIGPDLWLMPVRRSIDAPAPGEWTVQVKHDAAGAVSGLTVGCWLARKVDYIRT